MSCMCGDTHCPSCGPAQGNARCYVCGAWGADGGCADPPACAEALAGLQEYDAVRADYRAELEQHEEDG